MEFLSAEREGEQARIDWLIRLRWAAVAGVLSAIVAAGPLLRLVDNTGPLFLLVGALAGWNLALTIRVRGGRRVQNAGGQVVIDLLVLGLLLFFSRGLRNPFAIFIAVQVILAAILLPRKTALNVGLVGAGITVLLGTLEFANRLPDQDTGSWELPVWGVGIALLMTLAVALHLTAMVMDDLRERAREAHGYHQQADRERQKLFDVIRHVGAAMVLLDRDLHTEWQNIRAESVLGRLTRGKSFRLPGGGDPWPPRDEIETGRTIEGEWTGMDTDGRRRVHHMTASPVLGQDASLEQVILVFTDITDRRAAERQLQRTEKLAALGRLAAGVAHEINPPLGSVSILTSEAIAGLDGLTGAAPAVREELMEQLGDIRQETDRVAGLVRQLLELSHPGNENVFEIDPNSICEDAVQLISVRSPRSRARIRTDYGADLDEVRTVPDRLRQILLNLLDNALDATRTTGNPVTVRTRADDDATRIDIIDEGEGITEDDLERVFDPFFTTKDVGEGTGLGLYVSYEIMKNLGGDISIESTKGKGTRVRLTLPHTSVIQVEPTGS
ncbi:MAG: hypothetical protein CMJ83_13495 [Planctomycetes bacterium]|nr:hypothetical protein [Planctomycetota bacterium]